ncbi:MAG: Crp/Fnr family transcriptional regulator [Pontixanthobacter sp.]
MSNSLHLQAGGGLRSLVAPTLFGELSADIRLPLLARSPVLKFSDGQIIQHRGDTPNGFWVIKNGVVKIGQFRLNGEFRALALLSDGDSYGELAVFAASRRAVDSLADGPVQLHWIEAAAFETAILYDPACMRKLIGALAAQLQEVLGLLSGLGKGTSAARIAAVLTNLTGVREQRCLIRVSQDDLAELTGLTRATVNKCLGLFEQRGIIERRYGAVEICDVPMLRTAALT